MSFRRVLLCCPFVDVASWGLLAHSLTWDWMDRRLISPRPWASNAWPWAIMDACLVMVALLPAHDNKNGTRRIHGSNKWDHETPPLSICELLIHQWWEGRKRSATAGRDNSRKHDANSTHGNNDDESNNENEQKERQDFADDGKSGKKWQSKSTGTLALASSALCSPPLPLPPNLVERHPCCRHPSPAPRGPLGCSFLSSPGLLSTHGSFTFLAP